MNFLQKYMQKQKQNYVYENANPNAKAKSKSQLKSPIKHYRREELSPSVNALIHPNPQM